MKKPTRGRPRSYDPDEALQKAAELFWRNGFTATSLDNLAQATNMNRPSLYAAFGNKKSLYMKTLDHFEQSLKTTLEQMLKSDQTLIEDMKNFFHMFIEIYTSDQLGCYVISTATVESANDPDIKKKLSEIIKDSDALIETRIQKAKENNEIAKNTDIAILAKIISAILNNLSIRARTGAPQKELYQFTDDAIKYLLQE